eukprot:1117927-Rhodomonas_salina.6
MNAVAEGRSVRHWGQGEMRATLPIGGGAEGVEGLGRYRRGGVRPGSDACGRGEGGKELRRG